MKLKISLSLVALCSIPASLHAREAVPAPFRFQTLESDYEWDEDMAKARAVVASAVPLGTSFWKALEVFEHAGARCAGDRHDPQIARCTYSDWVTVHDYGRADLYWTAVVRLGDGQVQSLSLDRVVDEK